MFAVVSSLLLLLLFLLFLLLLLLLLSGLSACLGKKHEALNAFLSTEHLLVSNQNNSTIDRLRFSVSGKHTGIPADAAPAGVEVLP